MRFGDNDKGYMSRIWRHTNACDTLENIRKMDKTKNYSSLLSMVENLQIMFTSMEDALSIQAEFKQLDKARKAANVSIKKYSTEIRKKKPDMEKIKSILKDMKGLC